MTTARARKRPARSTDGPTRDPFVKTINGVEISVPSMAFIKPGMVRKIRHENSVLEQHLALLELLLDEEQLAVMDELEREDFLDFITEWQKHSGVDLGES